MGWSPLSTEVHNTSQYSARTQPPQGVVLHHGATTSADAIIDMEVSGSRQVSSHQVVKDKRIAGVVQEQFRAWSLSSAEWDSWAFTVECANESTNGWTISDESHESLAQLTADWAKRAGFWPHRDGNPETWTLLGHREVYTIHGASYATACPGGMNLDFVAKRAQQILVGETPKKKEENPMQNYTAFGRGFILGQNYLLISDGNSTTDKWKEWYGAPKDLGGAYFEPGKAPASAYKDPAAAQINLEMRAHGLSGDFSVWANLPNRVQYNESPAGGGSGESSAAIAIAVDAKLAPRFDKIPTAAENGAAARNSIVK